MAATRSYSQERILRTIDAKGKQLTGGLREPGSPDDSLKKRDKYADSITIHFRYLDSTQNYKLDSSVGDYTTRFPIPATYVFLGNTGSAARSILFTPPAEPGWDAGFHAFDLYKWTLNKVRFFNTTRPYSEINYVLASRSEQLIELTHTQNVKPNWNFLLQYRMINAPGFMKNQHANHNSYMFSNWIQSVNKRYNNYFAIVSNKLQSSESGGIVDTIDYLHDPNYFDRFNIPTKIGGDATYGKNFFSTQIGVGNIYKDFSVLLRQQYDFGKKDSIVTDSTVIPLFFPRLRFEHTISYSSSQYLFDDRPYINRTGYVYNPDSAYYKNNYNHSMRVGDSIYLRDKWKEVINDFSIYQFPDAKNQHQFIKLGIALQNLTGEFSNGKKSYHNLYGHAEYRNRSKNQKWDIEANGKLYFTGLNAGDYRAYISLQRLIGEKLGSLQLGFENVNRTPSYVFTPGSSFYLSDPEPKLNKENTTHLFAMYSLPGIRLQLSGDYYLLTNYTYIENFREVKQAASLFNVLKIGLHKTIKIGRRWNWHTDVYFQQTIGNAPVNLPQIFTRNRFGYEGNLGFKNLDIAFGLELRYHTPYKADGYSPALGKFFYQNKTTIKNKLPDMAGYLHFRIKPFKAFVRLENLNTIKLSGTALQFTNNNLAADGYLYSGLLFRLGIYWSFVN